jgi:hypothetical protein
LANPPFGVDRKKSRIHRDEYRIPFALRRAFLAGVAAWGSDGACFSSHLMSLFEPVGRDSRQTVRGWPLLFRFAASSPAARGIQRRERESAVDY